MIPALMPSVGSVTPAKASPIGATAASVATVQDGGFPGVLQTVTMQQGMPTAQGHETAAEDPSVSGDAHPDEAPTTTDDKDTAEGPILGAAALLLTSAMLCPLQGHAQSPGDTIVATGSSNGVASSGADSAECLVQAEPSGPAIAARVGTLGLPLVDTTADVTAETAAEAPTSEAVAVISDLPPRGSGGQPKEPVPAAEGSGELTPEGIATVAPDSRARQGTPAATSVVPEAPQGVTPGRKESETGAPESAAAAPLVPVAAEPFALHGRLDPVLPLGMRGEASRGAQKAEQISGVAHTSDERELRVNVPVPLAPGDLPRQALANTVAPSGAAEEHRGTAGAPADDTVGVVPVPSEALSSPSQRETPPDTEDHRDAPHERRQDPPTGLERVGATGAPGEPSALQAARPMGPARESMSQLGMERVLSAARTSTAHGGMEVRVRLHPEALGEVSVRIRWEGGVLNARLEAATPAARDALETGAHTLRAALQEQGIPVERLSVGIRLDLEARSHPQDPGPAPERGPAAERPPSAAAAPAETAKVSAPVGRLDIRI